jgi:iron donor protein CyaY
MTLSRLPCITRLTLRRGVSTEAEVEVAFHRVADEMLGNLEDVVEAWGEDNDVEDFDFSHEEGVVTIQMGTHGTYVINKQGPNRQVWVSSPGGGLTALHPKVTSFTSVYSLEISGAYKHLGRAA